jgi:PPOX class probable F420-dependent enzyme
VVELTEALDRLREARVATLATVRPDGRPHAVPFVFDLVMRQERPTLYWVVDRKPKTSEHLQRLRNLESDPNAEVLVHGYEDVDWSRLWWVRASGSARTVADPGERLRAMQGLQSKYPQYAAEAPDGVLVAIDLVDVSGWAATDRAPRADGASRTKVGCRDRA